MTQLSWVAWHQIRQSDRRIVTQALCLHRTPSSSASLPARYYPNEKGLPPTPFPPLQSHLGWFLFKTMIHRVVDYLTSPNTFGSCLFVFMGNLGLLLLLLFPSSDQFSFLYYCLGVVLNVFCAVHVHMHGNVGAWVAKVSYCIDLGGQGM